MFRAQAASAFDDVVGKLPELQDAMSVFIIQLTICLATSSQGHG
jgi:hypothetical protein